MFRKCPGHRARLNILRLEDRTVSASLLCWYRPVISDSVTADTSWRGAAPEVPPSTLAISSATTSSPILEGAYSARPCGALPSPALSLLHIVVVHFNHRYLPIDFSSRLEALA